MKIVQIDANSVHEENGGIYLSVFAADYFGLHDGEKILAYEGDEIWNGIIRCFTSDNIKKWYVELSSPYGTMSEDEKKWNTAGFQNGFQLGAEIERAKIVQRMLSLNCGIDEIEKIIDMNEELRDRVNKFI